MKLRTKSLMLKSVVDNGDQTEVGGTKEVETILPVADISSFS